MILQAISLASIDESIQEYEEKTNIHLQKPEKRLKECLEEAALSTTAHGFEKIISHKKLSLKLIWILLLVASVGVCIYFVVKSVADYLDYEVVTKIQSFYELPVLFPTVTICNVNMYNNKQSIEFAKRKIAENRIKDSFDGDEFGPGVTPYNFALNIKYMASAYFRNLTTDELKYYGSKYNETFISCSFSLSTCDETYFEWFYDIYYGSCWRFNPKNLSIGQIYTYRPGPLLGLRVEVFVPEIEDPFAFANDRGVIVFVQNASDTKLPSTAVGVKAQVGTETNIQIGRQFISKLENPYSSCVNLESSGSKLYKVFVDMGLEYTQFACFDLCYQYEALKKCGCIDSTYIQLPGQPVCMNFSQTICNTDTFMAFYDKDHLTKCDCPLECDSQTFPLTVSSSSYPTRALANQMVNHTGYELANFFPNVSDVTYEDLKSHTLCLNFYYGDMNYIYIQELAKTGFFDLISSIGGLLGLFIGTSFLSFFELVDVFLRFLYSEFEYKKAKKKARRLNKV